MHLSEILKLKFTNIDFLNQVILRDEGAGPYIHKWDLSLGPCPTDEDLAKWAIELAPVKELEAVRELRRKAYPNIGDQLDALYKAMENGTLPKVDGFYDQIKLVKEAFPKPE